MSALRSYSQIQPRSPYLIVTRLSEVGAFVKFPKPIFSTLSSNVPFGVQEDYTNAIPPAEDLQNIQPGWIFKDLGRSVTSYAPFGQMFVYRECQLISGPKVEGVPEESPYYGATYLVRVWSSDGQGVCVARLG